MKRPLLIGIGGAHSGAGKTTCASQLLKRLRGWGAIKYTKTALYSSIIDDREILSQKDKDTAVLLNSGAETVLWVQSPPEDLGEVLPQAVERLSGLKGIIVEGNSAIEFLKPDIIIFIFGSSPERIKESAKKVLKTADAVIYRTLPADMVLSGVKEGARIFHQHPKDDAALMHYIEDMIEKKDQLRALLETHAEGRKIPCSRARKLAEELNIPYEDVGKSADNLGIKITDCELGCF